MQFKRLGNSQLMVSPLAFGGNVIGWTINEKQSFEILDAFVAQGFNFIDTADIYCRWASGIGGESETIIGRWLRKNNRSNIILATKVGMDMGNGSMGLSKKYIIKAVDASLKRLQTDYIDLYQSHTDDEKTPVEETLDAYAQLIKAGKVRYIGASNFTKERLTHSLDISHKYNLPAYQTLQPHYNLCERKTFENELEKVCVDNSISVINYFPLASGFLTGKYRNSSDFGKSVRGGGMSKFMNENGLKLLNALDRVAAKHKCPVAAVTLAWYLARPSIAAPIASATTIEQLHELIRSTEIKLDATDISDIDSCSRYS